MLMIAFPIAPALAADFARDSAPRKWFEPLTPEDLPPLDYPKYFNDFDKAKADAFAGRYKLALQTLRGVKNADPVEVTLVKGQSLSALGRYDDALKALSDPTVADKPRTQLERAAVLEKLGRIADALSLLKDPSSELRKLLE